MNSEVIHSTWESDDGWVICGEKLDAVRTDPDDRKVTCPQCIAFIAGMDLVLEDPLQEKM